MNKSHTHPEDLDIEIDDREDACDRCPDGTYQYEYVYLRGERQEQTGNLECDHCGHIVSAKV